MPTHIPSYCYMSSRVVTHVLMWYKHIQVTRWNKWKKYINFGFRTNQRNLLYIRQFESIDTVSINLQTSMASACWKRDASPDDGCIMVYLKITKFDKRGSLPKRSNKNFPMAKPGEKNTSFTGSEVPSAVSLGSMFISIPIGIHVWYIYVHLVEFLW